MIRILLTLLPLTLASCGIIQKMGQKKSETQEVKKIPARQVVGRIASVSETGKFVLIQKYGPGKLPKKSLFQTHGVDGSSASLKPTGERVRDFFAADIISGKTTQGDAVSSFRLLPEKTAESPASKELNPASDANEGE
ncbi:hypothetical protein N9F50_00230 [Akkermansiaceae bacterium]|nr:hypothetical protein [Akkermansiaceae bacterium]